MKSFSLYGTHAFLWRHDGPGPLGGGTSRATAISNNGVVVGTSALINDTDHAFRWTQASGMIDLNTLLKPNSGWVLVDAYGVNDNGQITGYGLHNGAGHAFRFDPHELPPAKQ